MFKRFMRSSTVAKLLGWLIAAYMRFIKRTTRWEVEIPPATAALLKTDAGFIAMTWHSRFMMLNAAWTTGQQQPFVLISRSRDGEIVANAARNLGVNVIRGSAKKASKKDSKGGAQAGHEILSALNGGGCIVITPDGPRGPKQRLQPGALRLAKMSGAPVVGCLFAVQNRKMFIKSWDQFILPLPFGRGRIIWTDPFTISPDWAAGPIAVEAQRIEYVMNTLLRRAEHDMGHLHNMPAPDRKYPPA